MLYSKDYKNLAKCAEWLEDISYHHINKYVLLLMCFDNKQANNFGSFKTI